METNIDFRYRNYIIILSVSLDTDLGPLGRDPKKQISVCPARVFFRNKVQLPVHISYRMMLSFMVNSARLVTSLGTWHTRNTITMQTSTTERFISLWWHELLRWERRWANLSKQINYKRHLWPMHYLYNNTWSSCRCRGWDRTGRRRGGCPSRSAWPRTCSTLTDV